MDNEIIPLKIINATKNGYWQTLICEREFNLEVIASSSLNKKTKAFPDNYEQIVIKMESLLVMIFPIAAFLCLQFVSTAFSANSAVSGK